MNDLLKKIQKVKSFDKRIELFKSGYTGLDAIEKREALRCCTEAAKAGQHFLETASAAVVALGNEAGEFAELAAEKADKSFLTQLGEASLYLELSGKHEKALELANAIKNSNGLPMQRVMSAGAMSAVPALKAIAEEIFKCALDAVAPDMKAWATKEYETKFISSMNVKFVVENLKL